MNWMTLQTLLGPMLLALMVALPASLLLTARLTRPDIFFSITVEPSLRPSAAGQAILRRFSRAVILFSLIGLALTLTGVFAGFVPVLGLGLILSGAGVEFAGLIMAYTTARRQVRPYQVEPSQEREMVVKPRPVRPVGGWWGQGGPFLILVVAALCLWRRWDAIPQRFPVHWDLYGRPDGWAIKGWRSVFGSVFLGTLICLFLSVLFISMARGVRRIRSSGLEGERESRFLRMMLLMVLVLEYCMAAIFGFSALLPPRLTTLFVMADLLAGVAVVVVAVRSGQGGWRLQGQSPVAASGIQAPVGDRTVSGNSRTWDSHAASR